MTGSPNDETGRPEDAGSPAPAEASASSTPSTPEAEIVPAAPDPVGTTEDADVEIVAAAVRVSITPEQEAAQTSGRTPSAGPEPATGPQLTGAGPPGAGGPPGGGPPGGGPGRSEGETPEGRAPSPLDVTEIDIATRVGDTVDDVVALVRDKTVVPAERVVHAAALSLVVVMLALALFTMLVIGTVRILTYYVGEERVYLAYWGAGIVFLAGGAVLWVMAARQRARS